jgi:hypothetical protein
LDFSILSLHVLLLLSIGGIAMMTTEPRLAVVPPRIHMSQMADQLIDGLVDEHVFKHPRACVGMTEVSGRSGMLRCTECGANFDQMVANRFFDEPGHLRLVPNYTRNSGAAWDIIDNLRWLSRETQICFALFLDAAVYEAETRRKPQTLNGCTKQQIIFGMTPRLVCLAALQAIDVIGVDGYFVEGGVQ